ncbi:helix-turn-helix domain-containing protein [Marinobacterium litorale]|uniref:helix-turn-helix domain-containing protein n=1 Tax=Marinobacterium litorale TaxID=404770 RepID=UPI00040310ED|nr:helix-turn-helix domain-containing protein [Marinobacterium litorale]
MATSRIRNYSNTTRLIIQQLGYEIQSARKQRQMTTEELSERAGIGRKTLYRIEQGDPRVEIGLVLEVALLVGLSPLASRYEQSSGGYATSRDAFKTPSIKRAINKTRKAVKDDF